MLFCKYDLNQTSKVEVYFGSNTERQFWSGGSLPSGIPGEGGLGELGTRLSFLEDESDRSPHPPQFESKS